MRRPLADAGRSAALPAIVLLALVFRSWGLFWGLQDADIARRPHPDEWPVYWLFQWFSSHQLSPCPNAHGQCFFDWGMVFPYLAYAFHLMTLPLSSSVAAHDFGSQAGPVFVDSVLAGRIASVLASTVTVAVVYSLGNLAYGRAAALVAALVSALSTLLIQLAHFATPDSTTVLLVAVTLLLALIAMRDPSPARFGLTGVAVGLAIGSEYHMALLLLPLVTAWYLCAGRRLSWLFMAVGCAAAAYFVPNLYSLIDFQAFLAATEHTIRIRTVASQVQYQGRFAPYGSIWLYVVRYTLGYGVGFALSAWMVGAIVFAVVRRQRADVLLLSWVLPYFILITLSPAKFMRYSAPLLPALAVLVGALVVWLWRSQDNWVRLLVSRARGRAMNRRRLLDDKSAGYESSSADHAEGAGWIRVLVVVAGVFTLAWTLAYDSAYAGLFASPDPRFVATQWMEHHVARHARVAFELLPNGLINLPYFVGAAGYHPCFTQFYARRLSGPMAYVMVDNFTLEEHPRVSAGQVSRYEKALTHSSGYRAIALVHYTPTFLGLRFPIDGSPHDWRYPDHVITIYRQTKPGPASALCFANLGAAREALYVRQGEGS